ncbi:efflux RND transporter permease subunit [Pseudorhodobacter sp.]|uniref:efflux RND transporter permease subunit n=1 Tax=Pseudorhodobacter sp. TaxID=1934400 RepID=UPI0026471C57|nr:efflux RND transporter permease subunit [Pseudorhodobacter sp.]MDN5788209.1 efflux RND transporter permease subunit [Pseudorhodobacter sp.]
MSRLIKPSQGAALAALFVRRPVLAFVLNAIIMVAGIAALLGTQVQELPNVSRPIVTVNTNYAGASADTVDSAVTDVIEGAVARVSGVTGLSSSSRYGSSRTTIEFDQSVDLNIAASDVRDAVSRAVRNLPDEAETPTVVKADSNSSAIMRLAVTSDTLGRGRLTDLVNDTIVDRLAAVNGVADVQVYGDQAQVVTVDINPAALAARGLTLADLRSVLGSASYDTPAGKLNAANQNIIVRATGDVLTTAQMENIEIKPGVRVRDVASVYLAPETGTTSIRAQGKSGIGLGIVGQAQSNTIQISEGVRAAVEDIRTTLPKGVNLAVSSDDAVFIQGAVDEVLRAMFFSVLIVTAIIFVFLRDWRATLIPAVSMPVALGGAMAGLYLAGFSINILTLLALVLATGLVVDDAIIVLENIVRQRSLGYKARAAAVLGTQEVYFAVLSTTVTLAAVFVPIAFLPGQVGALFAEFGYTLAIAVMFSSVVALSLTPMMAARMLGAVKAKPAEPGLIARFGMWLARFYAWSLHHALQVPLVVLTLAGIVAFTAFVGFGTLRQELTPPEDRSGIFIRVNAPQNVSLTYTQGKMQQIERLMQPLRDAGEIANVFSISGFGGSTNRGFIAVTLAQQDARARGQQEIAADINRFIAQVPGVRAFAISPNSLGVRGGGNGLQFALVGTSYDTLAGAADQVVDRLSADPRFGNVNSSYDTTQAQVRVRIDRERADTLGIDITGIGATLQTMLDGLSIGDFIIDDINYPIHLQASAQPINDPTDLTNIFAKTRSGKYIPLSEFVHVTEGSAAPSLDREQQRRAITITAGLSDGFAIGTAYSAARTLLLPDLPPGVSIIPLAEAATIDTNANGLATTFGFAALIILLVLAAQFESFVSAAIIMVTVPFGLACAVFALLLTGGSLNVYSEIGLVLLVGIMAKNGILVVEFANQLRDDGLSVRDAIERASAIRLRPIMMTKLATILGAVPLILAHGPGAEAREALGWVIVGALGFAAVSTLYLTPATYLLFAGLSKPRAHEAQELDDELAQAMAADAPV